MCDTPRLGPPRCMWLQPKATWRPSSKYLFFNGSMPRTFLCLELKNQKTKFCQWTGLLLFYPRYILVCNCLVQFFLLWFWHLLLVLSRILCQCGLDVSAMDFDGWTPLHAAAHWGQGEACYILAEQLCNMESRSNAVRPKKYMKTIISRRCRLCSACSFIYRKNMYHDRQNIVFYMGT